MSGISESYKKVRYDLRPAKQVERLMLLDSFRRLTYGGFKIESYQYTGMGSIHFYDYSLFRKYAGITRMLSAEVSRKISRRVRFNRPFRSVEVRIEPVGNVIPTLRQTRRHLVWLDYDSTIRASYLADTTQAVATITPGSLLLITVDVEPPKDLQRPKDIRDEYMSEFGDLLPQGLKPVGFTPKNLSGLNADLLWRAVARGLSGRAGLSFQPLYNFLYRDGHRMLTVGGMLADGDAKERLASCGIYDAPYVRKAFGRRHYVITVPVLTKKERIVMDASMPCSDGWRPKQFELPARDVRAYRNIYQYAPNFGELIF